MKFTSMMISATCLLAGAGFAGDVVYPVGEGDFNWGNYQSFADAHDYSGETLTVFGPLLGTEQEQLQNVLNYFAEATGADVRYSGSDSFEQQIVVDAEAGSAPNIAIFPQPGLARKMASRGFLSSMSDGVADNIRQRYSAGQSWVDLATFDNKDGNSDLFGVFFKADVKSLVWYSPENFEDEGYEVPQTMEELKALTEQMAADGNTPWCIGVASGSATGWPATDWVEDMMLRTSAPAVYDDWVANEIRFDDPAVIQAIEEYGFFAQNDDFVSGGANSVAATDFRDSPKGLFSAPAQCFMHHQASFVPAFFPEGTVVGEDADFFYMPAYAGKDLGKPVLGAGTLYTITKDSPAARGLIAFLQEPIAHEIWMAQGGFLTPHNQVNVDLFSDDATRKMNDILLNATTFRFDASDLMPGAIGAGAFWTGMVDYSGGKAASDVAAEIQSAWDNLK